MRPHLSIIVPFHKGLSLLDRSLGALGPAAPGDELIVVADGAVDDCHALAAAHGARVVEIAGPRGPAAARNAAAAVATGDVLVFVDADVVASTTALERVAQIFSERPDLSAVFGAYDENPAAEGFVSQYKNLAHSYFHRVSGGPAKTFWAGFGAVRRSAYMAVGGFDERFARPSIEDIDLGYRLSEAGHQILLDPSLAVCHLKRWTLWSMFKSDVLDRGIPWTQLILRYGQFGSDLNVRTTYRVCVVAAYLAVACAIGGLVDARLLWGVVPPAALLAYLGRDYYRFFWRRRGFGFALRVFPLHFLYHLYNGVSFVAGTILFLAVRHFDVRLPGALPAQAAGRRLIGAPEAGEAEAAAARRMASTADAP
ncbi:MAG: glycosyltransferase family 2 protein [Acidobacteriota bacterium]